MVEKIIKSKYSLNSLKRRSPKQPKLSAKNGTMHSAKLSAHKLFDQSTNAPLNFFCGSQVKNTENEISLTDFKRLSK